MVKIKLNKIDFTEEPKYKKKSSGNHTQKSKHKHQYVDCLLIDKNKCPHKAEYCIECGKIHNVYFFLSEKQRDGFYKMLTDKEVCDKFADLPRFEVVDCLYDKYVTI